MHRIDETSPLWGCQCQELIDAEGEVMVLLSGHHEGFQQEVHARYAYAAEEIGWGFRFVDVFRNLPDGRRAIDYALFDDIRDGRTARAVARANRPVRLVCFKACWPRPGPADYVRRCGS